MGLPHTRDYLQVRIFITVLSVDAPGSQRLPQTKILWWVVLQWDSDNSFIRASRLDTKISTRVTILSKSKVPALIYITEKTGLKHTLTKKAKTLVHTSKCIRYKTPLVPWEYIPGWPGLDTSFIREVVFKLSSEYWIEVNWGWSRYGRGIYSVSHIINMVGNS